jgi:hypothetical protein
MVQGRFSYEEQYYTDLQELTGLRMEYAGAQNAKTQGAGGTARFEDRVLVYLLTTLESSYLLYVFYMSGLQREIQLAADDTRCSVCFL